MIKARQMEGIAIKKAAGGYKGKGRKRAITEEKIPEIKVRVAAGEKKTKIAADLKISRESIYKYLKGRYTLEPERTAVGKFGASE